MEAPSVLQLVQGRSLAASASAVHPNILRQPATGRGPAVPAPVRTVAPSTAVRVTVEPDPWPRELQQVQRDVPATREAPADLPAVGLPEPRRLGQVRSRSRRRTAAGSPHSPRGGRPRGHARAGRPGEPAPRVIPGRLLRRAAATNPRAFPHRPSADGRAHARPCSHSRSRHTRPRRAGTGHRRHRLCRHAPGAFARRSRSGGPGPGRNAKAGLALQALGADFRPVDLRDETAVVAACEGMARVAHVGALSSAWGRYEDFYATNVRGTQHVIAGCLRHGARTAWVYVSSPSVMSRHEPQLGLDEDSPLPDAFVSPYSETKKLAEDRVREAGDRCRRSFFARRPSTGLATRRSSLGSSTRHGAADCRFLATALRSRTSRTSRMSCRQSVWLCRCRPRGMHVSRHRRRRCFAVGSHLRDHVPTGHSETSPPHARDLSERCG